MEQPRPLRPAKPPADNVALAKGCITTLLIGACLLAFWACLLAFWAAFLYITISAFD